LCHIVACLAYETACQRDGLRRRIRNRGNNSNNGNNGNNNPFLGPVPSGSVIDLRPIGEFSNAYVREDHFI